MQYEPIGYILEYEISALIFLIVIITRYFAAKRFPNQKNRLFAIIAQEILDQEFTQVELLLARLPPGSSQLFHIFFVDF